VCVCVCVSVRLDDYLPCCSSDGFFDDRGKALHPNMLTEIIIVVMFLLQHATPL